MIIFANYRFLLLLLLVPVFPMLYGVAMWLRSRRMARLGDPDLVKELMPSVSKTKGWVRIVLFSLAFAFFVIGLARPQIGAKIKEQKLKGAEIMIALDVSNSMLAEDYSPNRLERAKLAMSRLVDKLHGDRIGLVVFAGDAFVQLPVTTDYVSAKMFVNSISTESVAIQGTAMAEAIRLSIKGFSTQSENSRAIIVITDGENHEDDPVAMAREAAQMGIKVFTIGVGSPEGKPIPMDGGLLKDKDGNTVVTRLDEETLRNVALAGGGSYVRAGNTEFGLNPIVESIKKLDEEEFSSQVFEEYDEQYMYFFAIALLLFVIEMLIGSRRNRRQLFMIAVLLCVGINANAQVDKRQVRAGNRDYEKANYHEADVDYRKALLKDSTSVAANYNLANTCYQLSGGQKAVGSQEEAKKFYAAIEKSIEGHASEADYWFNVGDLALAGKDYKTAVEAFKKSLLKNPGDLDAKENYIYAKMKLEEQQQNQQNQQNQDQNQDQQNQDQQNQDQQNQDQNQDQQNQDQNQDQQNQDQQNQDQQRQQQQPQMSPQAAQQLLQALQAKENETQDKVKKEKALMLQSKQKDKNW